MTSFYSPNYLLSFGGDRNDLLSAASNEDTINFNQIALVYIKNIDIHNNILPTSRTMYMIGVAGIYSIKGLINDPTNLFLTYLFATDKNIASGTFGVFKIDFTPTTLKYVYTALSMSSGSSFSVNCIIKTSLTDANDFLFAG